MQQAEAALTAALAVFRQSHRGLTQEEKDAVGKRAKQAGQNAAFAA